MFVVSVVVYRSSYLFCKGMMVYFSLSTINGIFEKRESIMWHLKWMFWCLVLVCFGSLVLCGLLKADSDDLRAHDYEAATFHLVDDDSKIVVFFRERRATPEQTNQIVLWLNNDQRFRRLMSDRTKVTPFPMPVKHEVEDGDEEEFPIIRNGLPEDFEKGGKYERKSSSIKPKILNSNRPDEIPADTKLSDYEAHNIGGYSGPRFGPAFAPGVGENRIGNFRTYKIQCGIDD